MAELRKGHPCGGVLSLNLYVKGGRRYPLWRRSCKRPATHAVLSVAECGEPRWDYLCQKCIGSADRFGAVCRCSSGSHEVTIVTTVSIGAGD